MQKGWVKLHRQIINNTMWQRDHTASHLFITLLMLADSETGQYTCGRFQLADITGINPSTIYKALLRLKKAKMVTQTSNNKFTTISICNWRKYQAVGNTTANNKVTTKEQQSNTKQEIRIENIINTTNVVFGKPEINEVFSYWQETTGLEILSRVQSNRNAASNLVKKHGAEKVHQLIDGVALAQNDQYAPRISDFCDLQTKLNQLIVWGRQQSKSKGVKIS